MGESHPHQNHSSSRRSGDSVRRLAQGAQVSQNEADADLAEYEFFKIEEEVLEWLDYNYDELMKMVEEEEAHSQGDSQ